MLLKQLQLEGFRKYNNKLFKFKNGINFIYGPNEAGKSTLYRGILTALLGNGPNAKGMFKRSECLAWNQQEVCKGNLWFEIEGKNYEVSRDFLNANAKLFQEVEGQNVLVKETLKNVLEHVLQLFSVDDSKVLTRSIFIHQNDINSISEESTLNDIKKNLEKNIIGGEETKTPEEALKYLQGLRKQLKKRANEKPGLLDLLPQRLSNLKVNYLEKKDNYTNLFSSKEKNKKIKDSLLKLGKNENELKKLIEKSVLYKKHIDKKKELEEKFLVYTNKHKRLKELKEKISTHKSPDSNTNLGELKDKFLEYRDYKNEINILSTQLEQFRMHEDVELTKNKKRFILITKIFAGLVIGIFITAGILGTLSSWFLLLLLIIVPLLTAYLWNFYSQIKISRKFSHNSLIQKIDELKNKALLIAQEYSFDSETIQQIKDMENNRNTLKTLKLQYETLSQEISLEEVEKRINILTLELSKVDYALNNFENFNPSTEDIFKWEENHKDIVGEIQKLKHESAFIEGQTKNVTQSNLDLNSLKGEIEYLETYIKNLENKYDAINLSIELIEESMEDFKSNSLPKLEDMMSKYLKKWTQNRYQTVSLVKQWPSMTVSTKQNTYIDINDLSKGTLDQFYLALRLGISDSLKNGENLPLFLDDPFVHFDKKRLQDILDTLVEISKTRQIFLFSCHEHKMEMIKAYKGVNIVEL